MKVYLVRHGESEENLTKNYGGLTSELTSNGTKQTEFVANRLKSISIDKFFSSDMLRAKQTSEIINKVVKKKIVYTDLIREKSVPSIILGKNETDPSAQEIMTQIKSNFHDKSFQHSDEDTFTQFRDRILNL